MKTIALAIDFDEMVLVGFGHQSVEIYVATTLVEQKHSNLCF